MRRQRLAIDLDPATRRPNTLGDLDDDAGEAVLVDVDFLVVWDLAKSTVCALTMLASRKRDSLFFPFIYDHKPFVLPDICELLWQVAHNSPAEERGTSAGGASHDSSSTGCRSGGNGYLLLSNWASLEEEKEASFLLYGERVWIKRLPKKEKELVGSLLGRKEANAPRFAQLGVIGSMMCDVHRGQTRQRKLGMGGSHHPMGRVKTTQNK